MQLCCTCGHVAGILAIWLAHMRLMGRMLRARCQQTIQLAAPSLRYAVLPSACLGVPASCTLQAPTSLNNV